MGRRNDHFWSASEGGSIANRGPGMAQARAYKPEFIDHDQLEKLFLGVDFLNFLALKLLVVALLCLVGIEFS